VTDYPWYGAFAASVMCVLVGGTLIARSWALRHRGRHRAPRIPAAPARERYETAGWEYCPTEQRPMEHETGEYGELRCTGCRRVTEVV
jgi:hypothetical protein